MESEHRLKTLCTSTSFARFVRCCNTMNRHFLPNILEFQSRFRSLGLIQRNQRTGGRNQQRNPVMRKDDREHA